jgi:hypothetical protein
MRQRMIILASIFISAAVLVVIGAVSTNVFAQKSATPTPSATELAQAYQAREDAYSKLIADANQKLEEANNNLQDMQNQIAALQTQVQTSGPQAASAQKPAAAISAKDAAQIAEKVSADLIPPAKTPELVDFQGKTAYEVVYSKGSIYVDAQSGEVLFNGTVPQKITSDQAVTIASEYIKSTDVTLVDQITFNKILLFRVIFRTGAMVYMDMTGQIIYVNMGPSVVQAPSAGNAGGSSGGSSSSSFRGGGDDGGGD